jgi:hypothetical protein
MLDQSFAEDTDKADALKTTTRVLLNSGAGRETRRGAFTALKQLVRLDPSTSLASVGTILDDLELRAHRNALATDDLTGIGQAIYFVSNNDPAMGWILAERMIILGTTIGLGRAGWDKVAAVCSGTIRNGLDKPEVRREITGTLTQLPNIVQATIVRCARDQNDLEVFRLLATLELSPAARVELTQWAHERSRVIDSTPSLRRS